MKTLQRSMQAEMSTGIFCTVPSFAFPVEFLHFINTFVSELMSLCLQFELAGLSLLSGQAGVVGEDIIVNMGN